MHGDIAPHRRTPVVHTWRGCAGGELCLRTNAFLPLRKAPSLCTTTCIVHVVIHTHCHILYRHTLVSMPMSCTLHLLWGLCILSESCV